MSSLHMTNSNDVLTYTKMRYFFLFLLLNKYNIKLLEDVKQLNEIIKDHIQFLLTLLIYYC